MSAYTFTIKQNDRRPALRVQLKNADGTPLNLATATGVSFSMKQQGSIKIDKALATVTTATLGLVSYNWQANDTDTLGTYKGEFEITWSSGITQTMPSDDYIKIIVLDDLA
jgi:hypothetical protein